MKLLWICINNTKMHTPGKQSLFLILNTLICGLLGFLVWLPVQFHTLASVPGMLCFIGYPMVFFGFFGGILYLFNHDF